MSDDDGACDVSIALGDTGPVAEVIVAVAIDGVDGAAVVVVVVVGEDGDDGIVVALIVEATSTDSFSDVVL
jgi:Na+-translocating ferredoxin:NAD+ oxidoreductase RnfG subunit